MRKGNSWIISSANGFRVPERPVSGKQELSASFPVIKNVILRSPAQQMEEPLNPIEQMKAAKDAG
jgi:hypothetical protein